MKSTTKWILGALALLLVVGGTARVLAKREAAPSATPAVKAEPVIELTAGDVFTVQSIELSQGIPISGSLKAVNSALVKARVAGELQGLIVREGDAVKAGQMIARIDSSEYAARVRQASETADAAKAQIDMAQRSFDNNKALVDQGFISRTALDISLATLQSTQANHKAALAGLDVARKSVQDTVLTAPISGIVSQRMAQPGERVGIDTRVVEIVDVSRLELEAQLSASDSVQVRVGQPARLRLDGRSEEIAAVVSRINPSAQSSSRSVLVYLSVTGMAGLRQGLFAQGMLDTSRESALAVPLSAVRTDKPQPYVQMIENGRIVHKTVELSGRGEGSGAWQGITMVALKNIALGAMITPASAGNLRENTLVSLPGENSAVAKPAASLPPAPAKAATGG